MRHSRNATAVRREGDGTPAARLPAKDTTFFAVLTALHSRPAWGWGGRCSTASHRHTVTSAAVTLPVAGRCDIALLPAPSDSAPQRPQLSGPSPTLSFPAGPPHGVLGESATKRVGVGEGHCGAGLPIPRALPAPRWVKVMSFFVSNLRQWVTRQAQSYTEPPTGISLISVESTPHQTFRYLLIKATKGVTDCRIFLFLALID